MRKPGKKSSIGIGPRLQAVSPQLSITSPASLIPEPVSVERERIAKRLNAALLAMQLEACELVLDMAEKMACKHPATARIYLVSTGKSPAQVTEHRGVR